MIEICDIAKETIEILKYFDLSFVSKISKKVLELLEEISEESNIVVNIDSNKKLEDQNISEECKDLISLLYYDYVANENEKKEILKIWKNNEIVYQKGLEDKYNIDKIFEKKNQKRKLFQEKINVEETKLPVIAEKNILKRIISFIKNLWS